jgi:peptide/nickel transport system ATP-binding protein
MSEAALSVRDLVVEYPVRGERTWRRGRHRAVDGVSFEVARGEFVALVGESGSGKSSIANAVMGLAPVVGGSIRIGSDELTGQPLRRARRLRRTAQLVMQDPYQALDPHMTLEQIVAEPLQVHRLVTGKAARAEAVRHALARVGLDTSDEFLSRLPRDLSGGQRQRVCVAAALIVEPQLIIADEPVSMLDVSVRAGILRLLDEQRAQGRSIMMITHDLITALAFCDRVMVLERGRIVEQGPAARIGSAPRHPYTRSLLDASPRMRGAEFEAAIEG